MKIFIPRICVLWALRHGRASGISLRRSGNSFLLPVLQLPDDVICIDLYAAHIHLHGPNVLVYALVMLFVGSGAFGGGSRTVIFGLETGYGFEL